MELAVLTLFAVLLIGALAAGVPYFVCPDSRSDPVFGIQLEMDLPWNRRGKCV